MNLINNRDLDLIVTEFLIAQRQSFIFLQSANCQLNTDLLFTATLLPRVSQLSKPPGLDDSEAVLNFSSVVTSLRSVKDALQCILPKNKH